MTDTATPHVAILGAGPIGLDAALACADAGLPYTVHEAGPTVGTHVRDWGHVRLFTPWELNLSPRMHARLGDLRPQDGTCPTGTELADLLDSLTRLTPLAGRIELSTRVLAVARDGLLKHEYIGAPERAAAPFRLLLDGPEGERAAYADTVLDCTGTYAHPNSLGDGGIPAPGERSLHHRIIRTVPDTTEPDRWRGTVLLVGAGKSAQTAARDLARLPDTHVEWVVRTDDPDWGEVPADALPGRQELVDWPRADRTG
ncbi:hypothetical protein JW613_28790 [Streptomyces smyrnaeus]|uniref:Flavoprotein n=1 Tax=Streptomyces smyrnaeus TaxID=1387713 RepID=A0ABS3Y420_9ACTN|nr:hypothetical protein [Streptomyces smyrnaeus]MBO8202253.1 hypothetical protein [Streptomyces smyrnaeus]